LGLRRIIKIKYTSTINIEQIINEILAKPNVVYAEPVYKSKPSGTSQSWVYRAATISPSAQVDDPEYIDGEQEYLKQVYAPEAWEILKSVAKPIKKPIIAIIDTGSELTHEDLAANIYHNEADPIDGIDNDNNGYIDDYNGWDFTDNDNDPTVTRMKHGIHVSGLASAVTNNGKGIASIANNCAQLMILRAPVEDATPDINALQAVTYAVDHGANVINCSFGWYYFSNCSKDVFQDAIQQNCLVVAAVGNEGDKGNLLQYPAGFEGVLSVANVSSLDQKHASSNYGSHVSLTAPGQVIISTFADDSYEYMSGSSMSAPLVSSAASLVKAIFPELTMA
jgi:subtilisin family serine protease